MKAIEQYVHVVLFSIFLEVFVIVVETLEFDYIYSRSKLRRLSTIAFMCNCFTLLLYN